MKNHKIILLLLIVVLSSLAYAANVCCEKTNYGAFCINEDNSKCAEGRTTPTSCESTSYCKPGCCYDSKEGICMENTPQLVCQMQNGTWADDAECSIPQCSLGCCVLGDQASFVTLVRCKKLSSFFGVNTDFRRSVTDEVACIGLAGLEDKGACVYEEEFEVRCKMTTRGGCSSSGNNSITGKFYKDYLCTAEELNTVCGPTEDTMCVEGKDEVYFKDSCGNPANIYDASKIKDTAYWKKIINKAEACGDGNSNQNSKTCGNCDYLSGSICGKGNAQYGNNICQGLDCKSTSNGKSYKHGESWCMYDTKVGEGNDLVGSRHWRHMCVAGEEIVEACADFRQGICIQDSIETSRGSFSQAGCRANRWQDCLAQTEQDDCENIDKRDCIWKEGMIVVNPLVAETSTPTTENSTGQQIRESYCIPKYTPGLNFWEEGEAQGICSQASFTATIKTEEGYFCRILGIGGEEEVTDGSEFLEPAFQLRQADFCKSLGDCVVGKVLYDEEESEYVEEGYGNKGIWTLGRNINKGVVGPNNAAVLVLAEIIIDKIRD